LVVDLLWWQASRKILDDGAAAMRDGAKARVLQGHKALQRLGEMHVQLRHRSAAASSCRFQLPLPAAASSCRFQLPLSAAASSCRFQLPLPAAASSCRFQLPLPAAASSCRFQLLIYIGELSYSFILLQAQRQRGQRYISVCALCAVASFFETLIFFIVALFSRLSSLL
jgi:hypothetical protein